MSYPRLACPRQSQPGLARPSLARRTALSRYEFAFQQSVQYAQSFQKIFVASV